MSGQRHTFADNRSVTVAEAITGFAHYDGRHALAIASGYFNPGGFIAVADALEAAPSVRILLGAEPEPFQIADRLERRDSDPGARVSELRKALAVGRNMLPFARATDEELERLLGFLARPTTEVRIYRQRFLHGKAFIFGKDAAAIAGSANFTRAGLLSNYELDLGHFDPDKVSRVSQWFEDLWKDAESFDLAGVYSARFAEFEPYRIYLRMLYEYYEAEATADDETTRRLITLRLAEFQRLGSSRAQHILDEWGGALIADGVGLGKTYVAGDIMVRYAKERGEHVLVVCPAALRSMWQRFAFQYSLPLNIVSYTELANDRIVGDGGSDTLQGLSPKYYRLVVADEAHMLRNPDTGYYRAVRRLLQKAPDAHLLMLTATPVNNSIRDLYHEILLFARNDAYFSRIGVPSLKELFDRAERLPIEDLDPSILFPLLDAIAVRRPRAFIRREFPDATLDGPSGPVPIVFPTPQLKRVNYDLDGLDPGLFERAANAIDDGLTLARYRPLAYAVDATEFSSEAVQQEILAGLLRSQMLKRFESSIEAFRATARKLADASGKLLAFIRNTQTVPIDKFDPMSLDAESLPEETVDDPEKFAPLDAFKATDLARDLQADIELLNSLVKQTELIRPQDDPKLEALLALLVEAGRATGDARKTLVFTTFADTLDYIKAFLELEVPRHTELAYLKGRMAFGTRNLSADERVALAVGFAPHSMRPGDDEADDEFDLLVSTDVLSEGQNLQQCGRVVNYDLPWNPMRIAQRNGRIDRIGSPHTNITLACFFPDTELDRLLGLELRLLRKIAHANAAVGAGAILPGVAEIEHAFIDDEKKIRRLLDEDASAIEDLDVDDAYLGEVFREELRRALLHEAREQYEELPWGVGSGFVGSGKMMVIYLSRVGRGTGARSELVSYTPPDSIADDRLKSLREAKCAPDTPRHYPPALRDIAIDGWERTRSAIISRYNAERDPKTRQTRLSRAQRSSVDLLQREGSAEAFAAAEALSVPWPIDVQRSLRSILDDEGSADTAKVRSLIELVSDRGLTPPLVDDTPAIESDDVHLVCYQIVSN
ncbi:MAG TPA: helicase-related protein [Chloroflexota bacterium]|nr:helicase-related protein [Chloroflexota bacterium]